MLREKESGRHAVQGMSAALKPRDTRMMTSTNLFTAGLDDTLKTRMRALCEIEHLECPVMFAQRSSSPQHRRTEDPCRSSEQSVNGDLF